MTTTATKIAATASVDQTSVKSANPVVAAFSSQSSTTVDRLRACQVGLARLYGELRWLEEHPDDVDDLLETGRSISRRIRALKRLTELELRQRRLEGGTPEVDFNSPLVRQVVALFMDTLANVTRDVVSADDADDIITMFESRVKTDPEIPWP